MPDLLVITDVCLCEYTSHGHCGIVEGDEILNDISVAQLAEAALSHAVAGADIVAPSDMMDGRVGRHPRGARRARIRATAIISYAAKYCSAFYGPFRDAADSTPQFGDRRVHQMDPANVEEALREVETGPRGRRRHHHGEARAALPGRDLAREGGVGKPTAAYHVSGEYAMLKARGAKGWIDEPRGMLETLTAIKRAGADIIITYYAREAARIL